MFLVRCRMWAGTRKLKGDALEGCTDGSKRVLERTLFKITLRSVLFQESIGFRREE